MNKDIVGRKLEVEGATLTIIEVPFEESPGTVCKDYFGMDVRDFICCGKDQGGAEWIMSFSMHMDFDGDFDKLSDDELEYSLKYAERSGM